MKKIIHTSKLLPPFEYIFNIEAIKMLRLRKEALSLAEKIPKHDKFCIFIGSSGVGRDTVLEACMEYIDESIRIRRTTTRGLREDIKDQSRMIFIDEQTFLKDFKSGKILFAGRYSANNKLYGIGQDELVKVKNNHEKIALLEENFSGLPLKVMLPASRLIIVLPPSIEVIKQRLFNRDKSDEENKKRFEISVTEIKAVLGNIGGMIKEGFVDMVVINDDNPQKTAEKISNAISKGKKIIEDYSYLKDSFKKLGRFI